MTTRAGLEEGEEKKEDTVFSSPIILLPLPVARPPLPLVHARALPHLNRHISGESFKKLELLYWLVNIDSKKTRNKDKITPHWTCHWAGQWP